MKSRLQLRDHPFRPLRRTVREQAGPGADVGDRLPRFNLACRHDLVATGEQLSALDFEATDEFLHIGIAK